MKSNNNVRLKMLLLTDYKKGLGPDLFFVRFFKYLFEPIITLRLALKRAQ